VRKASLAYAHREPMSGLASFDLDATRGEDCGPVARPIVCSAAASCRAAAKRPAGSAACADEGLPVTMLDGELLGEGDALLDVLDEGLDEGDWLGDCEGVEDELGVPVGLALCDGDGDPELGRQLAAAMAD
jgi:hypothetical protein